MQVSKFSKETSTHNPLLIKMVQMSTGDVCELGSGLFSTPLLHWLCRGRRLVTYENDLEYYEFAKKFVSKSHRIHLVKSFDEVDTKRRWGVVLIDHSPEDHSRRGIDAIRLKDCADYIILHDTEPEEETKYGYDKVWPLFKYRHDWTGVKPFTTVISNFKDLSNL